MIEEAPAELAAAPAPVFVAPDLAEVTAAMPATLPEAAPAPIPAAQDTTVVNAGAQAAMMAARLPFLIFSSF